MEMKMENSTNDIPRLQACINDLVSFLALPAMWSGREPDYIVGSLLDALLSMLRLDFIYARLNDLAGGSMVEAVRVAERQNTIQPQEIGRMLERWLTHDLPASSGVAPNLLREGAIQVACFGLGLEKETGLMVAGSERADFPTETETLLLRVAANQAAIELQGAKILSERKQAEEALRHAERRFREMIDALPVAIYTTDAEGRLTHFNRAAVEFSGRVPELGTDHWCVSWKLYYPDGTPMPHDECPMAIALKEGRAIRMAEAIAERPDGKRIWFTPYPTPLRDSAGRIVGGINMLLDITERKRHEQRLTEQARLLDLSSDAIIVRDLNDRIIYSNHGAEETYGWRSDEAMGKNLYELLHVEFFEPVEQIIEKLRRDNRWEGEVTQQRRDGTRITVGTRWVLDRDAQGNPASILQTDNDITGHKRAEEAKARLAAIVESSEDAIISKDLNGIIKSWNRAAERLFGYTAQEAVGQSITMLIPPDRIDEESDILGCIRRGERIEHFETVRRRKDGTLLDISLTISPIVDARGQIVGASKITRDITERKRAEAKLKQLLASEQAMRAEAERANRMKDEFLATVSHELRTPLNAILGWATIIRRSKTDQTLLDRALETIERNARSQAQLIEDLLDVSRIISGKLCLDVKPTELMSIIKAAIDSVRPAAEAKGVKLQIVLDPSADSILGDAARLQQVVWNLVSNAIKFTPKGGLVQIKLDRTDSSAQITVSDTGQGISPKFLPYVFDRFQQADSAKTRMHGGLGLGLAIARHIAEMHGGTIEAYSAGEGQGAAFTVKLPLVAVRSAGPLSARDLARASVPEESLIEKDSPNLDGLRILAVDDEPDTRQMLKGVLERYGAHVMTAASAKDALYALLEWKPNVLVSDIGMPEQDGYSLIRKVRELKPEQGGDTPAIALTGYVRVEERLRSLEAGYQMFVPKPVEADELAAIIASLVGRTDKA